MTCLVSIQYKLKLILFMQIVWLIQVLEGGSDVFNGSKNFGKSKKSTSFSTQARERKPNIILILTDDQDVELGELIKFNINFLTYYLN